MLHKTDPNGAAFGQGPRGQGRVFQRISNTFILRTVTQCHAFSQELAPMSESRDPDWSTIGLEMVGNESPLFDMRDEALS